MHYLHSSVLLLETFLNIHIRQHFLQPLKGPHSPSLEPRLSVLDFVSQLWRKIGFSPKLRDEIRNGKLGFEANIAFRSHWREGEGSHYLCFRWGFLHWRFLGTNDQLNTSSGFDLLNPLLLHWIGSCRLHLVAAFKQEITGSHSST